MLNVTYSKTAKVFTVNSIVIFLLAGTVVTVFHVYANNHASCLNGCVGTSNEAVLNISLFVVFLVFFGQTTLLGLFFYTLTKAGNQEISNFARLLDDSCCCYLQKFMKNSNLLKTNLKALPNRLQVQFPTEQ